MRQPSSEGMRAKEKTPAAVNDLRLRTRTALLGLESKDVQGQAHLGAQSLISDLTMDWEYHQVLRDLLIVEQSNLSARRLRYRLASYLLQQRAFSKDEKLVQILTKKIISMASVEKQAAASEDLCGLIHDITRIALAVHAQDSEANSEDTWISAALVRPLLQSAIKSPESQTASTLYRLAHAALTVVCESAQPLCMVAASSSALKQMLSCLSTGQNGVVVPEEFQALKQCAEMLGGKMPPPMVEQFLQQCAKHAKQSSSWPVRMKAVDALGALAASLQVYKQADGEWQLEKSASLAVLRSHRAAIEALLADVKYDKIAHVRQAAQKVIAEMQRIPMPSPRKAGAPQHENPAESGEDASHEGRSLEPSQENVSKPVESKPEPQYADHGKDFAGRGGNERPVKVNVRGPLRSHDGNVSPPSKPQDSKHGPADRTSSSASIHRKANQPAMKRRVRPREAGHMDFGVQVYAKPPPTIQESTQVERRVNGSSNRPAAAKDAPTAAQELTPEPRSSTSGQPLQAPPDVTSSGWFLMDPSSLLQQLQLFQDQLRHFASPQSAAAGQQTPQQPMLIDQEAETVNSRAAVKGQAASEVSQHDISLSERKTDPADAAGQTAISSHYSFRQAMMERLCTQSQSRLSNALSTVQSPLDFSSAQGSGDRSAHAFQQVAGQHQPMPFYSTVSSTVRSAVMANANAGGEGPGGVPVTHVLSESQADMSASVGSPASRALESIRTMLHSLPEPSFSIGPDSAPNASAEEVSPMYNLARQSTPSGLRQNSSDLACDIADGDNEEGGSNAGITLNHAFPRDSDSRYDGSSMRANGNLSGVERELIRLLGPKFRRAERTSGSGLAEDSKTRSSSDSGDARSISSISSRHNQGAVPVGRDNGTDRVQRHSFCMPSPPAAASVDGRSDSSPCKDESGSLSRVHSNPLFSEEADLTAKEVERNASKLQPAAAELDGKHGRGGESASVADERVMGALGQVLDTSMKLDNKRLPGASPGLSKLRQKLSEDLKALQELLLDT